MVTHMCSFSLQNRRKAGATALEEDILGSSMSTLLEPRHSNHNLYIDSCSSHGKVHAHRRRHSQNASLDRYIQSRMLINLSDVLRSVLMLKNLDEISQKHEIPCDSMLLPNNS